MICRVTSEHQFSAAIREEIKFAVSKNTSPLRICTQPYLDFKISVMSNFNLQVSRKTGQGKEKERVPTR